VSAPHDPARTLVIVGGGYAGAVLALKASRARPQDRVVLVEKRRRAGAGVAYGACAPGHLLNVPVSRMESGLTPGFEDWLRGCGADLSEALAESGGRLADAFAPRALFGRYMEARLAEAVSPDPRRGLVRVYGAAVRMLEAPRRGVALEDGREVEGDAVVLATGNSCPHPGPTRALLGLGEAAELVPDPWAEPWDEAALDGLDPDATVLLVGAGLTMVDVALRLAWTGRRGPMLAVSRRALAPQRHVAGGAWEGFLAAAAPPTPLAALRLLRRQAAAARAAGVPWQRVFDAARPDVARTWRGWSLPSRRRFLRHGRALWDTHRHRMAPRVADALDALLRDGRLTVEAGRVSGAERTADGLRVRLRLRGGGERWVGPVARVFNCTGPRSDYDAVETPLFAHLRRAGLAQGDGLGLGLVTRDCAVIGADGEASGWLYAVGGLTRPALWEITAVPEINAQVDALVARMSRRETSPLHLAFADLGAGI
jgi:uncharacterized NAD(P)/FAD-binding protein YdhS